MDRSGVLFIETFGEERKPYKLWKGDLWSCRYCEFELIAGFGQCPVAQHFDDDFKQKVDREIERFGRAFYSHEKGGPSE